MLPVSTFPLLPWIAELASFAVEKVLLVVEKAKFGLYYWSWNGTIAKAWYGVRTVVELMDIFNFFGGMMACSLSLFGLVTKKGVVDC